MDLSDMSGNIIFSDEMFELMQKYKRKFGEKPPSFNYDQYTCGEDMFEKISEAIKTGKPIIPKKELSMFDI